MGLSSYVTFLLRDFSLGFASENRGQNPQVTMAGDSPEKVFVNTRVGATQRSAIPSRKPPLSESTITGYREAGKGRERQNLDGIPALLAQRFQMFGAGLDRFPAEPAG
jgi:hypothetical protein